jgi:uncharacterized membrane protein YcaP (DUF421 family)
VTVGDVIAPLFGRVDWERLLLPTTPLLETVIRGSFVYLALFALLRFVFRRESGAARISMLLLLVWSGLRQHGVEDVSDVKAAYLEGDGQLSVLRRGQKGGHDDNSPQARRRAAR